jgi:hypothetical protein
MTFIARKSSHIQEDIKRNWSSWNFGEGGFEGTYSELQNKIKEALESESSLFISGFELWDNDIKKADIRELYTNYWVLVDNTNGYGNGIFGTELKAESLEDAIQESKSAHYWGEGAFLRFDASSAKLVYSNDDIHIFEIE